MFIVSGWVCRNVFGWFTEIVSPFQKNTRQWDAMHVHVEASWPCEKAPTSSAMADDMSLEELLAWVKPFNYSPLVLSLSLTCCINELVCTILLWSNKCPSPQCFFYTSSGWLKFAYVTNPILPETRHVTYKLHSHRHSCFHFSIFPILYMQDTFTPFSNFEVGHLAYTFLFLSFGVAMKGIQFTHSLSHFISLVHLAHHLFFIQPWTVAEFT